MTDSDKIVVFDVRTGDFGIYTDLVKAAAQVSMTPQNLRNAIIDGGAYYTRGIFVGYGEVFKSNRGGRRS